MKRALGTALALSLVLSAIPVSFADTELYNQNYSAERASYTAKRDYHRISYFFYTGVACKTYKMDGQYYYDYLMPGLDFIKGVEYSYEASRVGPSMKRIKKYIDELYIIKNNPPAGFPANEYKRSVMAKRTAFFDLLEDAANGKKADGEFTVYDVFNERFMKKYAKEQGYRDAYKEMVAELIEKKSGYPVGTDDEDFRMLFRAVKYAGRAMYYMNEATGEEIYKSCNRYN